MVVRRRRGDGVRDDMGALYSPTRRAQLLERHRGAQHDIRNVPVEHELANEDAAVAHHGERRKPQPTHAGVVGDFAEAMKESTNPAHRTVTLSHTRLCST